jgi:hypothetical protein
MTRSLFKYLLALAAVILIATQSLAAPDRTANGLFGKKPGAGQARMELLVFERADCGYCEMFRTRIAPAYASGVTGLRAPLRYIDIDRADIDEGKMGLKARINVVPTAVLMRDGVEVDRIVGLTAPQTFQTLIQHMMPSVDD